MLKYKIKLMFIFFQNPSKLNENFNVNYRLKFILFIDFFISQRIYYSNNWNKGFVFLIEINKSKVN